MDRYVCVDVVLIQVGSSYGYYLLIHIHLGLSCLGWCWALPEGPVTRATWGISWRIFGWVKTCQNLLYSLDWQENLYIYIYINKGNIVLIIHYIIVYIYTYISLLFIVIREIGRNTLYFMGKVMVSGVDVPSHPVIYHREFTSIQQSILGYL